MSQWYIIIIISTLYIATECGFFKKNERIVTNIEYFKTCGKEEDNRLKIHLNTHKYNRSHTGVNMNITIYENFDIRYTLDLELRLWGDGGWKPNFFNYKRENACNTLYLVLGKAWTEIIDAAGANRGCPVKPGFYNFDNYFINVANIPIFAMPGRFLFIAKVTKKEVPQLCFLAEVMLTTELMN